MPRLTESIPKYRKHRASGQAVCTLNGKDHYLGPHGTKASKIAYDRLVAEWLAGGRQTKQAATEITVTELCVRYMKFAKGYYQKDGRCTRVTPAIKCALKYLREWYGKDPAVEFGPVALKALRQRMVDDGHSRRYVNDHVGRLKRMYKWAAGEELIPESAYRSLALVQGLRRGRSEARETAPVMPANEIAVDATLEYLPAVVAGMVRLQRLTGMRPAEVCILRPCDLDRSADVWLYRPASHKTEHHGRERVVFIGPQARGILTPYLLREAETYCFSPIEAVRGKHRCQRAARKTRVQPSQVNRSKRNPKVKAGECYTTDSYRRAIHRAADKAGVEKWSPNRLRHSAATNVRKEFGLEHAQIVLGHASADVSQIYAERDMAKGVEVAAAIG